MLSLRFALSLAARGAALTALLSVAPNLPVQAASLKAALDGGSVELDAAAPLDGELRGAPGGRAYFEPAPRKPISETCTFSMDVLCSDDTGWMDREVFGARHRFDPSGDPPGMPVTGGAGLATGIGLSTGTHGTSHVGGTPPAAQSAGSAPAD